MTTAHETALETAFQKSLVAGNVDTIAEIHRKLLNHEYGPDWLVDAVFQGRDSTSLRDAYGFALVWSHLMSGDVGCAPVWLGHAPGADSGHAVNQSKLDVIQAPFRATVIRQDGKGANDDGKFEWREGITLTWHPNGTREDRNVDPDWVSLEIGTTAVSKTLWHLRGSNGVARWPYGHDRLVVLYSPTWRRNQKILAEML